MISKENYRLALWENHTIVNLWTMLKFYADDFMKQIRSMDFLTNVKPVGEKGKINLFKWAETSIHPLKDSLEKYGLSLSAITANKIIETLKIQAKDETALQFFINELVGRIHDELSTRFIFLLDSEQVKLYDTLFLGTEITDFLPNTIDDIAETGKCYALGRYTASVFHLMRIMEKTVQKFAVNLGIPLSITCDKEWQIILNDIRCQLKTLYPKHSDPDRIKYEKIIDRLETVKIAWRNPTMHPKATYTQEEAKALISAIEIFMKELVKIL
jgi:hypothetical protein